MSVAASIAQGLAEQAETVCRHYLSAGYRAGNLWKVGDARNTKPKPNGGSMTVVLSGERAGRWRDYNVAAEHDHGDLLDVIRHAMGFADLRDAMNEAKTFLGDAAIEPVQPRERERTSQDSGDRETKAERARGIFARCKPIAGSQAEGYLFMRGITCAKRYPSIRAHPRLHYPNDPENPDPLAATHYPALVTAISDVNGNTTGIQRTFLEPGFPGKAKVLEPRKALGNVYGHAVWFGKPAETAVIGEGIETVLSVLEACPDLVGAALLSGNNIAGLLIPPSIRRILFARDNDPAGHAVAQKLRDAAESKEIDVVTLAPSRNDFNDDLKAFGANGLAELLKNQMPA